MSGRDRGAGDRERVYEAFADPDRDLGDAVERALAVGTERLGVAHGFLTRIRDGEQTVVRSVGSHERLQPGESCPLDRAYCRETVDRQGLLSVQDADASERVSRTAYETFELGCYVGSKVLVDGETYGTVCFADATPRTEPFDEAERTFVELVARLVGQAFERRRHETRLRERNEQLRAEKRRFEGIAEASFDILYRVDREGRFTYLSQSVERVLGRPPEALVGEPFAARMYPESEEAALAAFERALDGEAVEGLTVRLEDGDGDVVVLESNVTPVREDEAAAGAGGSVVAVQGVARDVTRRRAREEELRLKNRAIDDARVGISIADVRRPDAPLVYVNAEFERLTGYDRAAASGRNCRFLQGPATDPEARGRLREAVESETATTVELVNYRYDGAPFWNRLTLTPVTDDAGAVTHFVGFQQDTTESKRTARLVELLNRVLRHNLRNDMTAVLGYAGLLAEDGAELPDGVDPLSRPRENAEGLVALAERARDLEAVANQEREPTRLSPPALVDRALGRCPPPDGRPLTVDADGTADVCAGPEVERALVELLDNAVAHGEGAVAARARDDPGGDQVVLAVADEGPGIPESEAAVVDAGRETPLEHGSGLGLWLVNWIATRYGGSFEVEATGDGTVATLRLPALGPEDEVSEVARPPTALFY